MAHVKAVSVGIEINGKERHFSVPSVRNGKKLTRQQIFDSAKRKSRTSKGFATPAEADKANQAESKAGQVKRAKQMKSQIAAAKRRK